MRLAISVSLDRTSGFEKGSDTVEVVTSVAVGHSRVSMGHSFPAGSAAACATAMAAAAPSNLRAHAVGENTSKERGVTRRTLMAMGAASSKQRGFRSLMREVVRLFVLGGAAYTTIVYSRQKRNNSKEKARSSYTMVPVPDV